MPSSPEAGLDLAAVGALTDEVLKSTLASKRSMRTQAEDRCEPSGGLTQVINVLLAELQRRASPPLTLAAQPLLPHVATQAEGAVDEGDTAPPVVTMEHKMLIRIYELSGDVGRLTDRVYLLADHVATALEDAAVARDEAAGLRDTLAELAALCDSRGEPAPPAAKRLRRGGASRRRA